MAIDRLAFFASLDKEQTIVFATCANNRVTIRPMSHIRWGCDVYFQTSESSLKMTQVASNPNVAFCCGTFEAEGKAVAQGHPLATENAWFVQAYQAKHPEAFARYSALPDEIIVKITVHRVRQWQYTDNQPHLAETLLQGEPK